LTYKSTAEISLPYENHPLSPAVRDRADELVQARYREPRPNEPLFGTTFRSVRLGFKGIDTPDNERLFGNRIRWVARTFRDARAERKNQ
jgi:hypothetical protein